METLKPSGETQVQKPVKRRSGCMKYFFTFLFFLLLLLVAFFYWKYFYTYSDGYRTGLLQKLSHKGYLVKTWEGELVLSSVTSTTNVPLAAEKFFFSVASDSVAHVLEGLEGKDVRLHYEQKNGALFWRGDSDYIVDGIELPNTLQNAPAQQQQPVNAVPVQPSVVPPVQQTPSPPPSTTNSDTTI